MLLNFNERGMREEIKYVYSFNLEIRDLNMLELLITLVSRPILYKNRNNNKS